MPILTRPAQKSSPTAWVVPPSLSRPLNPNPVHLRTTCGPHSLRIYEVFPPICPNCGGQMRIIAFITFSADIHRILEHIGVEPQAPRITPALGPPLWDDAVGRRWCAGVAGAGRGGGG